MMMKWGQALGQTQGIHTARCRSQPPPTRMTPGQNWRAQEEQLAGGTSSAQRAKSAWVVAGCSTFKGGWEGILSPASGAAAAEPSLSTAIQGEAGRNAGTVPAAASSLQCERKC